MVAAHSTSLGTVAGGTTVSSGATLELSPGDPGYIDTLAHCYFALKDYDNAVKFEKQAVEADPESGLLARALERFQAALATKNKNGE